MRTTEATYDTIGVGYGRQRRPDPRIAEQIDAALGRAETVVNVGAGAGSYEPTGRRVVAVEPSHTMLDQRTTGRGPAVQGVAERLPFPDDAFDASLSIWTVHHWADMVGGLLELGRVTVDRQVILTWDQAASEERFWFLRDYVPEFIPSEREKCPSIDLMTQVLGRVTVVPLLVPADCSDGFFAAYWRRPEAYLDEAVRASTSVFALADPSRYEDGLAHLEADLTSGRWHDRYEPLLALDELDVGVRLVIGHGRS